MYRSRLGTDLSDITLDYVSSINDDSEIALYDILGSQAHALMLFQQNIILQWSLLESRPDLPLHLVCSHGIG